MQRGIRRSSRFKQSKQSLLEETRLTSEAKVTRKTKKSTVANKETEAATNDMRVHSSHSEDIAVGECGKRTKTTDQSNLGLHADHAAVSEILYRR